MPTILIVDDEKHIPKDLSVFLIKGGYTPYPAYSVEEAKKLIDEQPQLDYAIIDLKLDNQSDFGGIEVFRQAKQRHPNAKIIMLSANPFLEERVLKEFGEQLKNEPNLPRILEEVKNCYIHKGGERNYILVVLEKLKELGGDC